MESVATKRRRTNGPFGLTLLGNAMRQLGAKRDAVAIAQRAGLS